MTTIDTPKRLSSEEINARTDGPVHGWFELSYANYLTIPRSLMQSMPVEWQQRMVACLEELDDAFRDVEQAPGYEVQACEWLAPYDMDVATLTRAGVTVDDECSESPTYYDRAGNELDGEIGRVAVPITDPVPHYNRGRTFIAGRA